MAKRTLLNDQQFSELLIKIDQWKAEFTSLPVLDYCKELSVRISNYTEACVRSELDSLPHWAKACPVYLGSWSKAELCPGSDLDLLFHGSETEVSKLVEDLNQKRLKIRYRMPENVEDWSEGVDVFDVLALQAAKTDFCSKALNGQQQKIKKKGHKFLKSLLKALKEERQDRNQRYDSIANYLEPNMKYGPGGLRDLQQALDIAEVYKSKFEGFETVFEELKSYKYLFLYIRQMLHMGHHSDILVATEQKTIAESLGFKSSREFMRLVQKSVSAVSFYADWIIEVSTASALRLKKLEDVQIESAYELLEFLKKDNGILAQAKVRTELNSLFTKASFSQKEIGSALAEYLPFASSSYIRAIFRSGFIYEAIPSFKQIEGLVQHDQYHRYTVDTHLMQTLREVYRIGSQPELLGKLVSYVDEMKDFDWEVLYWSALYHDLAKGQRGDHSVLGEELVRKDFKAFGLSKDLTDEVAWIVKNHLFLSHAAFRRNPNAPETWSWLAEKGFKGQRLLRMCLFTAIDIRSTNIDAWGPWKESLLFRLTESLNSKPAEKYLELTAKAKARGVNLESELIEGLESFVLEEVPVDILLDDFERLTKGGQELETLFWRKNDEDMWIRFHRKKDSQGLFLEFTKAFYATGCRVRESSVRSYPKYGVYDWFKVKTNKSERQLKNLFNNIDLSKVDVPEVEFTSVKLISETDEEIVLSFKGLNKDGVLLSAVKSLTQAGMFVLWARVMTWGRQIDDVFGVKKDSKNRDFFKDFVQSFNSK